MPVPVCIHCGTENPYIEQTVRLTETRYLSYDEEFTFRTNQCGCRETCEGCSNDLDNEVYVYDGGDTQFIVGHYEGEVIEGTHPINDYEEDTDQMSCYDTEISTEYVSFRTRCCSVERSHVRELIRLDTGPAVFDDGSESQYSQTVVRKPDGTREAVGGTVTAGSDMDEVLASLADLP